MTLEEARAAAREAERQARGAARAKLPSGMVGLASSIIDPARLTVLESLVIASLVERSQHEGDAETKALLELRDYWNTVREEIES